MHIVISIFVILVTLGFLWWGRVHSLGVWAFVLMTHGMFVYFFGSGLVHLPLIIGLLIIPVVFLTKGGFRPDPLSVTLAAMFFFTVLLSFVVGGGSQQSLMKLIAYAKPLFVCVLIAGSVRDKKDLSTISNYMLCGGVIGALFNIYQQVSGTQLSINPWDDSLSRAASLRGDPNDTAMLLLATFPLAYLKVQDGLGRITKVMYACAAGVVVVGVILTGSRAGFAVLSILLGALILRNARGRKSYSLGLPSIRNTVLAISVAAIGAGFAPSYYWERMSTLLSGKEVGGANSLYDRKYLLEKGLEIWLDNPFAGVGPGNFHAALYGDEFAIRNEDAGTVAHNFYVEFLVEFGTFGLLVFVTIVGFSIVRLLRLDSRMAAVGERNLGYSYSLGLLGMLVMGLTLSQGYNSVMWFYIGCGLGAKSIPPLLQRSSKIR